MRNRLALNDLMREFCAAEGITFLDLTAELQSTVERRSQRVLPRRLALECGRARDRRRRARPAAEGAEPVTRGLLQEMSPGERAPGLPGSWTAVTVRGPRPSLVVVVVRVVAPEGRVRVSSMVLFTLPSGVTLVVVTRETSCVPPSLPGSV